MNFRSDLCIEHHEAAKKPNDGIKVEEFQNGDIKITRINVFNEKGKKELGRPCGNYITVQTSPLSGSVGDEEAREVISEELKLMLPKSGSVLICGIGNTAITPDALGPKVADGILATRHISKELCEKTGLGELRSVSVISPGVLGQTGIEVGEMLYSVIDRISPSCVIAIDALASRRLSRLGCTVQLSDTGIVPGSGVGNARSELSKRTLGIPVISVGVPTVVDAGTLVYDLTGKQCVDSAALMMITPKEVDLLISRAAKLISHAINCTLQPHISPEDMLMITA